MKAYYSGSFDLFHMGHLVAIKEASRIAKEKGAKLVVGVNTDELYRDYKDKEPVIPYKYRFEIIDALKYVDLTVPQPTVNKMETLKKYDIDILFLCEEWVATHSEEIKYINDKGGEVVILPYFKGISASEIRDKLLQNYRDHERGLCDECHRKL